MKFYTRNWHNYVYQNYYYQVENNLLNLVLRITNAAYLRKENMDSKYNDELLKEMFNEYYESKKKYVSSYDYLEKEFNIYEKVNLLSYDEEFKNYKERIEKFVKEVKNALNVKETDIECLYLLAINKLNKRTHEILLDNIRYLHEKQIHNNVNTFLTSYDDYIETKKDTIQYKAFKELYNKGFADYSILNYQENKDSIVLKLAREMNNGITKQIIENYNIELIDGKLVSATRDASYVKHTDSFDDEIIKKYINIENYKEDIIKNGLISLFRIFIFEDYPFLIVLDIDYGCDRYEFIANNIIVESNKNTNNKLANVSFHDEKILDVKRTNNDITIIAKDDQGNRYIFNIKNASFASSKHYFSFEPNELKDVIIISLSYHEFDDKDNYIYLETASKDSPFNDVLYIYSNDINITVEK